MELLVLEQVKGNEEEVCPTTERTYDAILTAFWASDRKTQRTKHVWD